LSIFLRAEAGILLNFLGAEAGNPGITFLSLNWSTTFFCKNNRKLQNEKGQVEQFVNGCL